MDWTLWKEILGLIATAGASGLIAGRVVWMAVRDKVEAMVNEAIIGVEKRREEALRMERERVNRELDVLRERSGECRRVTAERLTQVEKGLNGDIQEIKLTLDSIETSLRELAGVKGELTSMRDTIRALISRQAP